MKKHPMTAWYNPRLLIKTGMRVVISSIFGEFSDRREMLAVSNPIAADPFDKSMDYRERDAGEDFWFDYMADTGDGWDPTFAMARLVTSKTLSMENSDIETHRGAVLVLGGDQVYPDPSNQAYRERFLNPFEQAHKDLESSLDKSDMPDLYAIPGNHDWYDGLAAFSSLFGRRKIDQPGKAGVGRPGRKIAGRKTYQTRSYFALALPDNWRIWAIDTQLSGYVDQSQIDYFVHAARHWMEKGSNVILCVSRPAWIISGLTEFSDAYQTFNYVESLPGTIEDDDGELMGHKVRLVLTGDVHHYSRYTENGRHFITAGGGGAFLHPTHHLKDEIRIGKVAPGHYAVTESGREFNLASHEGEPALFPKPADSKRMAWRNVFFGVLNPGMTLLYFLGYLVFNWILDASSRANTGQTLIEAVAVGGWQEALGTYVRLIISSPVNAVLMLSVFAAYCYFAGGHHKVRRVLIGGTHFLIQTIGSMAIAWFVVRKSGLMAAEKGWLTMVDDPIGKESGWLAMLADPFAIVLASFFAACGAATIFGLYLLISLNVFKRHFNEAYSSLGIKSFKNFVRLKIDKAGDLHVFPIGLRTVPNTVKSTTVLTPEYIEQPFVIPKDVE